MAEINIIQNNAGRPFVKSLWVENFKGFGSLHIDFTQQCTVIIGDNGYGKTSILDAMAVGVGARQLSLPGGQKYQRPIDKRNEVRNVLTQYQSVEPQLPCSVEVCMVEDDGKEMRVGRKINEDFKSEMIYSDRNQRDYYRRIFSEVRQGAPRDLPLIAFHSVYRLMELDERIVHQAKVSYATQGSRLEGYDDCFSSKSSSKYFLSWYKTLHETAAMNPEDAGFLALFRRSLLSCLEDWEDMYFSPKLDDFVFVGKNGIATPLHQMSTGYRTMAGLVADLVYRCIKLNPHLGVEAVAKTRGLVLIDEIDLHLHPSWQRRIVCELHSCFPCLQFVVTTNSPMIVLGASEIAQVVKLSEGGVVEDAGSDVGNYDMSLLLQSAWFDSVPPHSPKWDDVLRKRMELLEKPQLSDEERALLLQYDKELSLLPYGESSDEYRIRMLIDKMANKLDMES